jgi:hypothetical protein
MFSDKGHMLAVKKCYDYFFPGALKIIPTHIVGGTPQDCYYDGQCAIDYQIKMPDYDIFIQERIRRPKFYYESYTIDGVLYHYKDEITITKDNLKTGQQSEWYKLQKGMVDWFFYAFYDDVKNVFLQWSMTDGKSLGRAIKEGTLKPNSIKPNKKQQDFCGVRYDEISRNGIYYCIID